MNQYWIRYILKFTWILDFFGFWREFCLQLFFDANFYWIGEKDRILHIFGIFQFIFNILVHKFQFCISKTIFTFNSDFSIFFSWKRRNFDEFCKEKGPEIMWHNLLWSRCIKYRFCVAFSRKICHDNFQSFVNWKIMTIIQYQIEFYIRKNVYKVKKCMAVLAEGRRRTLKNWWEKCYQNQNKNVLNAEFYFVKSRF